MLKTKLTFGGVSAYSDFIKRAVVVSLCLIPEACKRYLFQSNFFFILRVSFVCLESFDVEGWRSSICMRGSLSNIQFILLALIKIYHKKISWR